MVVDDDVVRQIAHRGLFAAVADRAACLLEYVMLAARVSLPDHHLTAFLGGEPCRRLDLDKVLLGHDGLRAAPYDVPYHVHKGHSLPPYSKL